MSVHYLYQHSALAKLLCLQSFTYQRHFSKKVLDKRKYLTLYAESFGGETIEGSLVPAMSELRRLWNKRNS